MDRDIGTQRSCPIVGFLPRSHGDTEKSGKSGTPLQLTPDLLRAYDKCLHLTSDRGLCGTGPASRQVAIVGGDGATTIVSNRY